MSDSTKSAHTFHCRNSLWSRFEQMAKELECSVDYLINDAMKQYARQRGYGPRTTASPGNSHGSEIPPSAPPGFANRTAPMPAQPPVPMMSPQPSPTGQTTGVSQTARTLIRSPGAPARPSLSVAVTGRPPPGVMARRPAPPPPSARPPLAPPPLGNRQVSGSPGQRHPLYVYYMGQRYPVFKDRFVIGRGRQSSDLTIRDPNVSRQHAMIEFSNGQYYIVDMGSTNGIEYSGQRIQRRAVQDGDTYRVCDHELRLSYQ